MIGMFYPSLVCVLCLQYILVSPNSDDPVKIPFAFIKPFKFFGSTIKYIQVAENKTLYLGGSQTYNNITINVMSSLTLPWPSLTPLSVTNNAIVINNTDFAEKTKKAKEELKEVLKKFNKTGWVLLGHVNWNGNFSVDQSNETVSLEVLLLTADKSSFFLVKVGELIKVRTVAGIDTVFTPRQVKLASSITTLSSLSIPSVFETSNIGPGYEGSWLLQVDSYRTSNSVLCSMKVQPHSSIALYNSSHLYYKCDKGCNTVANNSKEYLKCNNGQWKKNMNNDVTCYKIICPKLKLDPAGMVGIDIRKSPKRPIGAGEGSVKYYCSKNYYIENDRAKNYCYMNGTWSTGPIGPKCHLNTSATCNTALLPHPNNTILLTHDPYKVTTRAEFECCRGYMSNVTDTTILCMDSGDWKSSQFRCDRKAVCRRPPPVVSNSILISLPPYYIKTTAQYQCIENYSPNTTKSSSVECLVYGAWDKPGFTCLPNSINKSGELFDNMTEISIIGALSATTLISILVTCFCICCRRKRRRDKRVVLTHPILVAEARADQAKSKTATEECPKCPEHINRFCTQHQGTRISWIPVIPSQKKKSISYINDSFEADF